MMDSVFFDSSFVMPFKGKCLRSMSLLWHGIQVGDSQRVVEVSLLRCSWKPQDLKYNKELRKKPCSCIHNCSFLL